MNDIAFLISAFIFLFVIYIISIKQKNKNKKKSHTNYRAISNPCNCNIDTSKKFFINN